MKRTLVALGVAAAVVAPMANAAPTVYGKLNMTVESLKDDINQANEVTRLVSNASRFGVKGDESLGDDLSAIYQIEWEVNTDDSDPSSGKFDLTARNRYLGLKSKTFGSIKAGQFDSALKLDQGDADLFNDYAGDIKTVQAGENRLANVIEYATPKFAGLQATVQYQTNDSANSAQSTHTAGSSFSVTYDNADLGLFVGLAADRDINGAGGVFTTKAQRDNERAAVTYKPVDGLFLTAMYTRSEVADAATAAAKMAETGYSLGAAYTIGSETLKAQYGKADAKDDSAFAAGTATQATVWSVGVDHKFTKQTKAMAFYTKLNGEDNTGAKTKDQSVIAIGMETKF